jgi:hypothetical protein
MAKLKDDPAVRELLEKQAATLTATHAKSLKAVSRKHLTVVKSLAADHVRDAKAAGDKNAAAAVKGFSNALIEQINSAQSQLAEAAD